MLGEDATSSSLVMSSLQLWTWDRKPTAGSPKSARAQHRKPPDTAYFDACHVGGLGGLPDCALVLRKNHHRPATGTIKPYVRRDWLNREPPR